MSNASSAVVRQNLEAGKPLVLHDRQGIQCHLTLGISQVGRVGLRPAGITIATQVHCHNGELPCELRRDTMPHGMGLGVTVQQQQWGPLARTNTMQRNAAALDAAGNKYWLRGGGRHGYFEFRTTRLTPKAVSAIPAMIIGVMGSAKSSQAIRAVQGGTR